MGNQETLLLKAVRKFKSYTYESVSEVFEDAINCIQEPTDISCCDEDDEDRFSRVRTNGRLNCGARHLQNDNYETRNCANSNYETGDNRTGNGTLNSDTTEQLRLSCPCCN